MGGDDGQDGRRGQGDRPRPPRRGRRRRRVRDPRGTTQRPVRPDSWRSPGAGADPSDRSAPEAGAQARPRRPVGVTQRRARCVEHGPRESSDRRRSGAPTTFRIAARRASPDAADVVVRHASARTRPRNDRPRAPQGEGGSVRSDGSEGAAGPAGRSGRRRVRPRSRSSRAWSTRSVSPARPSWRPSTASSRCPSPATISAC